MFYAIVIAFFVSGDVAVVVDKKSPYTTKAECKAVTKKIYAILFVKHGAFAMPKESCRTEEGWQGILGEEVWREYLRKFQGTSRRT